MQERDAGSSKQGGDRAGCRARGMMLRKGMISMRVMCDTVCGFSWET